MGLFSASRSWRAPLQLIDCWLPAPRPHHNAAAGSATPPSPLLQTFQRAGWLKPDGQTRPLPASMGKSGMGQPSAPCNASATPLRQKGRQPKARIAGGGRVWIAGRIEDVCAELERLDSLEQDTPKQQRAPLTPRPPSGPAWRSCGLRP